jgi:hypothetical protein
MALASAAGVSFRYDIADLAEANLPEEWFDVIALIFVHQLLEFRKAFHRKLSLFTEARGHDHSRSIFKVPDEIFLRWVKRS